jgi:hypothetical protein
MNIFDHFADLIFFALTTALAVIVIELVKSIIT